MIEERVYVQRQPGVHILAAIFVSLLIVILALWLLGVMTVKHVDGGPVVITIDFAKAERASQDAADKTGEALERAGQELREKSRPAPAQPAQREPTNAAASPAAGAP